MSEQAGSTIGRYKLLEMIGEGGMGTIWLAEQREPVKRRVALKIIKLGMDTKQVIARFEAERQALALMDHAHIAKVFDAGATDSGRPYFVMEYIKGIPIVEYCDSERLDMSARLELFTKVCQAIQHAHHKGIIHRDIKPSNVLVTMMDGAPIPKVIDFGIAKATAGDLTPKTLFTEHRQLIGTPAYMSPEQAEMSGLDIDTRSDVYSLGVLLYELLTGTTPFDTKTLLAAGHAEMMRVIREDEPHTPSRRISSLGDTGTRTAHKHHVNLKRLCAQLRGDLDWIVMKCLEKDRSRRYESATGLAADIKRHLDNEPILASPPGAGYKLKKFIRRNRGMVAATCVLATALVLGAAGTTTGLVRALDEKARADGEAEKAKRATEAEVIAKDEAQRNEREALAAAASAEAAQKQEEGARKRVEAINNFVIATLKAGDAINPNGGQDVTILSAMDRGIQDINSGRFKEDPAVEAALKGTIGHILYNNGRWREAEVLLRQAVDSERGLTQGDPNTLARDVNNLALVLHELGRKEDARVLFAEALAINQKLYPGDHEAVAKSLQNLGGSVSPEESLALRRQSLEMRRRLFKGDSDPVAHALMSLGSGLLELGRTAEAEPLFTGAVEMGQRVFKRDHPFMAIALSNLGRARFDLGRRAEGVTMLTEALAIHRRIYNPPHPHLARSIHNLAWLLKEDGRSSEAEPLFVEALQMRDRCFNGDNLDTSYTLSCLGGVLLAQRRFAEAEPLYARALAMQRRLHPGDNADVALTLQDIAVLLRDSGRTAEAEPMQTQAVDMYRRLFPGDNQKLSLALYTLADVRDQAGRVAEAIAPMEAALEMDRRQLPANHKNILADLEKLARIYNLNRKFEKATPLYEEASKGYEATLGRQDPLTLHVIGNLGANYFNVGRPADAIPLIEEAWNSAKKYPNLSQFGPFLLDAYVAVADPKNPASTARALALFDTLLAASRATLKKESPELAQELTSKSLRLITLKAYTRAEPLLREALAIREKHDPDKWTTFNTMSVLGEALFGQNKPTEAEPLLLAGYHGMKARESAILKDRGTTRLIQSLERLANFYSAQGNPTESSIWLAKLAEARSVESRPAPR